jgi:hypothetical protein
MFLNLKSNNMKNTRLFKLIFLMAVLISSIRAYAQSTLQVHIGGPDNEIATQVKVLQDASGTIIAGYTYDVLPFGATDITNAKMILMKINPAGNTILWQEKFGVDGKSNTIQNMIITHDSNIVVVGTIGRDAVYNSNTAAIMKFSSADGHMIWQQNLSDVAQTIGGEIFFGVTELGANADPTRNYALVAVGIHNFVPGGNVGMVCVFNEHGGYLYAETYHVVNAFGGSGLYGICTDPDGKNVYIVGSYSGNTNSGNAQVHKYTPLVTAVSGTMVWNQYFDFTLPGAVTDITGTHPGPLALQNNFFNDVYVAGGKLLIKGGSLHNFTTTNGDGENICRMNAMDGTGAELWQLQNSNMDYANSSKLALVNNDHIYNVQAPANLWVDPELALTGFSSNAVVTNITSLTTPPALPSTAKFTSPGAGGIHALLDMNISGSMLYMAGSTNDGLSFGERDIYYVITPMSLPIDSCNTPDTTALLPVNIMYVPEALQLNKFTPQFINVLPVATDYHIARICGCFPPPMPVASYAGCTDPCPGTPLTFVISGTPGAWVSWQWVDVDGSIHTEPAVHLDVTTGTATVTIPSGAIGTGLFQIVITSIANGDCRNNDGASFPITIKSPTADFASSPSPTICQNDCFHLYFTGPPNGIVYYTEVPGSGIPVAVHLDPSGYGVSLLICPFVTTTYQITAVSTMCCYHAFSGSSITVSVIPAPVVSLTSNSPVCEGSPIVLTATCVGCNSPYNWAGPASSLPATTPYATPGVYTIPFATMGNAGLYNVTGTYTDLNSRTRCSTVAYTNVIVNPAPWGVINCSPYCDGGDEVLTFTGTEGSIVTYASAGSTLGVITLPITGTGSAMYTVTISPAPPIGTTYYISDIEDPVTHCHNINPSFCTVAPYTIPPGCPLVYDYFSNTFSFPSLPIGSLVTIGMVNCSGYFVSSTTVTVTGASFPVPAGICYITVTMVQIGTCTYPYDCELYVGGVVKKPGSTTISAEASAPLKIVPSPNNGQFTLSGSLPDMANSKDVAVEVIDMLGKVVYSEKAAIDNGKIEKSIALGDNVANGVYLIKVKNATVSKVLRFTLER